MNTTKDSKEAAKESDPSQCHDVVQDAPNATLVYLQHGTPRHFKRGTQQDLCMFLLRGGWANDARALAQIGETQLAPEKPEFLDQNGNEQCLPECGCTQPITGWFLMGVS